MYNIYNHQTKETITDEYGHPILFHNEWTAEYYYGRHCQGMCNVIIKFIEKEEVCEVKI